MDSTQWLTLFLRFIFTLLDEEEISFERVRNFILEQCSQGVMTDADSDEAFKRIQRYLSN